LSTERFGFFTGVRGRGVPRTSGVGGSWRSALSLGKWHHACGGKRRLLRDPARV
jgi:hypothetical protein